jgi:hypothetical protein
VVCGAAAGDGDDVGVAGVKRFGCRYCEYRSERAGDVTVHERSHTGEKPYGCRFCEYRAARASVVTEHERSHSGEKPYGCRFCEYRAATASNITVHERIHSGEKPYGCRFCEYRAATASSITVHERQRRARPACSPLGYNKNNMHYASMNDDQSDSAQHHRDRRRVVWNFIAQQ